MDQVFVDRIYSEVGQLHIELERDPTVLGPNYIHEIMSRCRNYLNKVSHTRLTLSKMRRDLMVKIGGEETLFTVEKDRLLAEEDSVKRQPNIRDREALVNTLLRDRVNSISVLKSELLDLETVERAVKMVHEELIRTSTEIKTQRALIYSDRVSGGGYGDESNGTSTPSPPPSTIDEDELESLMRNEVPLVASAPAPKPVVPRKEPELDPELLEALASLDSEVPTTESEPEDILASVMKDEPQKTKAEEVVVPEATPPVAEVSSEGLISPDDPDLVRFIDTEIVAADPEPKKTKTPKAVPPVTPSDSGDFDFSDILSSL
jgi:hypothetical protein